MTDISTTFTPVSSFIGGILIGLSAIVLMATHGRIAGMTGIVAGLLPPIAKDNQWRILFLLAAVAAPLALTLLGQNFPVQVPVSNTLLIIGGLLVGVGVTFGGGCPSGHGVCGLSRLSKRSFVAVPVFMATAAITIYILRHVVGG